MQRLGVSPDSVSEPQDEEEGVTRKRCSSIVWSGALSLLLAVMTGPAQAGQEPLPPNSHAFGKGYSELTEGWLEWVWRFPPQPIRYLTTTELSPQ
jgi:hypothetical protein